MSGRARETVPRALLVGGSLMVLLLVLELATRQLLPVADIPRHQADPLVGYRLAPNQEGTWVGEGLRATYSINASGFNNEHDYAAERAPGRLRIAVLGDSYVEALHVERGRRFYDVLEAGLRSAGTPAEVFTYAASGYGTGQQLLLLGGEVTRAHPDLVLVLWVSNDLSDTACSVSDRDAIRPCFTLDDRGQLRHLPPRPHRPNRAARLALQSALVRYLAINRDLLGAWRSLWSDADQEASRRDEVYALEPPPAWDEAWKVVEECFVQMARFCRESNIPLLVVHQPIVPRDLEEELASMPGGADPALPAKRLAGLARQAGFRFFDLTPAFDTGGRIDPDRWINRGIGHWNPAAHEAVGQALVSPVIELLGGAGQGVRPGQTGPE